MSKIIFTNADGGVSVVHPTGEVLINELPAKLGLTDYEMLMMTRSPRTALSVMRG